MIQYTLPSEDRITITVHNALGQEVRLLVDQHQSAGLHTTIWDGRDDAGRPVPSGTYFLHLQAGNHTATRKVCVVR